MVNFGIPERVGEYDIKIGEYSVHVSIHQMNTRMSKMDLLGTRGTIGGTKSILGYDITVTDKEGNIVKSIKDIDERYFTEYMESIYKKYMDINPEELSNKLYSFICYGNGRRLSIPRGGVKISSIGDNFVKVVYAIDKWDVDIDGLISDLTNIGCTVKRLKDKNIRSFSCFVLSVLIPKQLSITERIVGKRLIRLTESNLRMIIENSVNSVLKEMKIGK